MYKKILVATDGSHLSEKAVKHAIELAAEQNAELFVLTVLPHFQQYFFDGPFKVREDDLNRLENNWVKESQALLEKTQQRAQEQGVKASTILKHAKMVSKGIIEAAKECEVDLIIMASHGRKGLDRVLLGSETQQVLISSAIPVLVLR